MELTDTQQQYINDYIRSIEETIGEQLNEKQRERALSRLRARIQEKLEGLSESPLSDASVLGVLQKLGQPETQAAILVRVWGDGLPTSPVSKPSSHSQAAIEPKVSRQKTAETEEAPASISQVEKVVRKRKPSYPIWLGVNLYLAQRFRLPLWALRSFCVLVGMVSGPVSLLLYMFVFVVLRISKSIKAPVPFHPLRLVVYPLLTAALTTFFYLVGIYGINLIRFAYEQYFERAIPELQEWAWLESKSLTMFIVALALLMPLSLFSAMPLANSWDYSIRRLTQAGVAIYAIAVSFGVASYIAGIILKFTSEFVD